MAPGVSCASSSHFASLTIWSFRHKPRRLFLCHVTPSTTGPQAVANHSPGDTHFEMLPKKKHYNNLLCAPKRTPLLGQTLKHVSVV